MSDSIQVALTQEDKAAMTFFQRAANAIVQASELAGRVEVMEKDITHLHDMNAQLHENKSGLEDVVSTLNERLAEANQTIGELTHTRDEGQRRLASLEIENSALENSLAETLRERDISREAHAETMTELRHAEGERDDARATLAGIRKAMGIEPPPPEPEKKAAAEEPVEPKVETAPERKEPEPEQPSPIVWSPIYDRLADPAPTESKVPDSYPTPTDDGYHF